jgi:hypothetical protein
MGVHPSDYDYALTFPVSFFNRPDVSHEIEVEHIREMMPPAPMWLLTDWAISFLSEVGNPERIAALKGTYTFLIGAKLYHEGRSFRPGRDRTSPGLWWHPVASLSRRWLSAPVAMAGVPGRRVLCVVTQTEM